MIPERLAATSESWLGEIENWVDQPERLLTKEAKAVIQALVVQLRGAWGGQALLQRAFDHTHADIWKERDALQRRVEAPETVFEKVKREIASDPQNRWCRNALIILNSLRGGETG